MAQIKAISNIGFVQNPTSNSTTTSRDHSNPLPAKKKRNLPGTPDPEAEVIALSPKTLMATNRFLCEICGKGFQRDQNLQLHRRGHNLPYKLKQRSTKEPKKRVYVCPEKTCVHNHPSRALGDLTGIKKHFFRKHGEKKWKCDKCSKRYAVQSDWKVHSKTCGTKEYRCDCGTLFSRRDSFITHRAFCDALAEETSRLNATSNMNINANLNGENINYHFIGTSYSSVLGPILSSQHFVFKSVSNNVDNEASEISQTTHGFPLFMGTNNRTQLGHESMPNNNNNNNNLQERHSLIGSVTSSQATLIFGDPLISFSNPPPINSDDYQSTLSANMSATPLLHKAAPILGATTSTESSSFFGLKSNDQAHDGNKFCGFHTSNPISTDQGNNMEKGIEGDYLMQMYNPAARTRQLVQSDEEWQTRDFLGTEVQPICHPSSINGWI